MEDIKHCRVCGTEEVEAFYKTHKTICWKCYREEKSRAGKAYHDGRKQWELAQQENQRRLEREAYQRAHTCVECGATCEESIYHLPRCVPCQNEYDAKLPRALCLECKQSFVVNIYGHLVVPYFEVHESTCPKCGNPWKVEYTDDGCVQFGCPGHAAGSGPAMYGRSDKYCPACREARRKKNRQVYPLCPMCNEPTSTQSGFLSEYQGFRLDIIKVCCKDCIPQFEALPNSEQLTWLRRAMVKTYGETAVIYALHYDVSGAVHHIGRTKHLKRRMAEYRRNWDKEIAAYSVLEELSFGPLSMERESRWILYALKSGWPIDNYDMFTPERRASKHAKWPEQEYQDEQSVPDRQNEVEAEERHRKEALLAAIADIEPLTCPFEVIKPLLKKFYNTCDSQIVDWYCQQLTKQG